MGTYDYAIVGAIACGITMVLGGIILLYKGAIQLEVVSKDPALSLELFERELKLTTRTPALGLFIIGLCFIGVSIYFGRDIAATPIEVLGNAENIDEPVTVMLRSEWPLSAQQGQVHHVIRPQIDVMWVIVSAPGYRPYVANFSKSDIKNGLNFGSITLEKVVDRIPANPANIAEVEAGINLPPLSDGWRFGMRSGL